MQLVPTFPWCSRDVELFLLEPDHVTADYVQWLNDPAVNQFLESRFVTHDIGSTRDFVAGVLRDPSALMWGIRWREADVHVGNIKLGPIDRRHRTGEIGLMIGARESWGKGLGATAIALVAEIASRQLGLRKLTAGCYGSNIGSARAFEKAGFVVEGVRRAHFLIDESPEDLILLARFLDDSRASLE